LANAYRQTYRCKKTGELKKTKSYRVEYRDADGFRRTCPGGPDYKSAMQLGSDLEREAAKVKVGGVSSFRESLMRPLSEHLAEYDRYHVQRGTDDRHRQQVVSRCSKVFAAVRAVAFMDVTVAKVEMHLADLADAGIGPRTRNTYRASLRSFLTWGKKTKRFPENPLEGLEAVNETSDVRRERRALTVEEMDRLLVAALERPTSELMALEASPAEEKLQEARRMGRERALTYKLLFVTGLRVGELRRIRWGDMDLSGDANKAGTILVAANVAKNKKKTALPIRPDMKADLLAWKKENPEALETDPILAIAPKPVPVLREDLASANPPIPYQDALGRYADMHSLRHSTATHLAVSGIAPRITQSLMRHSSIELTMGVYADAGFVERAAAAAALPRVKSIYVE
jgi:integrase